MLVYKILRANEWAALQADGELAGSPVDLTDGFVHLSTAEQAEATAARHFAGERDLWLLAMSAEVLGESLRWEPSRGGALFPHLYRALRLAEVSWAKPLSLEQDVHRFPDAWRDPAGA
ncbi:MAG: DUF952 domain-containing protein [Planctomycetes bacterium]|nr:DUF952 domain-containing protein [Planctomycetota bacterium]MCB9884902.1 DUF952 domain-containing protein [Planctomycetota bacterium]